MIQLILGCHNSIMLSLTYASTCCLRKLHSSKKFKIFGSAINLVQCGVELGFLLSDLNKSKSMESILHKSNEF